MTVAAVRRKFRSFVHRFAYIPVACPTFRWVHSNGGFRKAGKQSREKHVPAVRHENLDRMKYFSMKECTRSNTAMRKGIDNTPSPEHEAHIVESVDNLLDPLREAWGEYCTRKSLGGPGILVTSGYRGPALNAAVGGSKSSAHCCGYAFDLVPSNSNMEEFKDFCRSFLSERPFDQLISEAEDDNGMPRWMHVGYKSPHGEQRRQFLTMKNNSYCQMTGKPTFPAGKSD